MIPLSDVVGTLIGCASGRNVDTVIVDGKVVKRDGKLVDIDAARIGRSLSKHATACSATTTMTACGHPRPQAAAEGLSRAPAPGIIVTGAGGGMGSAAVAPTGRARNERSRSGLQAGGAGPAAEEIG